MYSPASYDQRVWNFRGHHMYRFVENERGCTSNTGYALRTTSWTRCGHIPLFRHFGPHCNEGCTSRSDAVDNDGIYGATKAEGCTSCVGRAFVCQYSIYQWIWIIDVFLRIGSLCSIVIVVFNIAVTITARLLFLRFDTQPGAASYEVFWHFARAVVWCGGTVVFLHQLSHCRRKRLQLVGNRRVSMTVRRRYEDPWKKHIFLAVLL